MFLNVHLTQGRTYISLLLQPLSFSLCWLICPTLSISPYNTSVFCFHTSPFCAILLSHFHLLINLPNLWALLNVFEYLRFIVNPYFHSTFNEKHKNREKWSVPADCKGMRCGCQIRCDPTEGQHEKLQHVCTHCRNQYNPLVHNLKHVFKQL